MLPEVCDVAHCKRLRRVPAPGSWVESTTTRGYSYVVVVVGIERDDGRGDRVDANAVLIAAGWTPPRPARAARPGPKKAPRGKSAKK